jgi:hypothetical protein
LIRLSYFSAGSFLIVGCDRDYVEEPSIDRQVSVRSEQFPAK